MMATPEVLNPNNNYVDIQPVAGTTDEYDIYLAVLANAVPLANFAIGTRQGGITGETIRAVYILHNSDPSITEPQRVILSIRDLGDSSIAANFACVGDIISDAAVNTEISVVKITGDLGRDSSDNNGLIIVDEARWFESLGNWYASVITQDSHPPLLYETVGGTTFSNAVRGGMYNFNGRQKYFSVWGSGGITGTPGQPFEIGGESIERIRANFIDEIAVGNIVVPANEIDVNWIYTATDFNSSTPVIIDQFGGLSNTDNHSPGGLEITRDYGATLQVNLLGLSNPQSGDPTIFTIGRTMLTGSNITLPANGLSAQLIINKENTSGQWLGSVNVGSTTLTGPIELDYTSYYTELSSELGGGAVGLAPFNFHQREIGPGAGQSMDCNPYQTEERALGRTDQLQFVDISHYGPVYATGVDPQFRVEFLPWMDVNQTWVDRTSLFEVDFAVTGSDSGSTSRIARIKATAANKEGFKAAGTWRIRPITGRVKCAGVIGDPNVKYVSSVVSGDLGAIGIRSWYQFDVRLELSPGVFALESGNGVQANDLTQWLIEPFETNADGETDAQDFIDMANEYTGN